MRHWMIAIVLGLAVGDSLAAAQGARLIGIVRTADAHQPISDARVTIFDDSLDRSRSRVVPAATSGLFVIDGVAPGKHLIMVRGIGYNPSARVIDVAIGRSDTVTFDLRGWTRPDRDSATMLAMMLEQQRDLAASRAHPELWNCEIRDSVVHRWAADLAIYADSAWKEQHQSLGWPRDSATFEKSVKPLTNRAECMRIAHALDEQEWALGSKPIPVFRVGRSYIIPTDYGSTWVLDSKGTVLFVIVVPS